MTLALADRAVALWRRMSHHAPTVLVEALAVSLRGEVLAADL